jgi:3-hydroxybutyrate dehydrogenase
MAELRAQYLVEVDYSAADMSRPEQVAGMAEQGVARFGSLDILVNNAGGRGATPSRCGAAASGRLRAPRAFR